MKPRHPPPSSPSNLGAIIFMVVLLNPLCLIMTPNPSTTTSTTAQAFTAIPTINNINSIDYSNPLSSSSSPYRFFEAYYYFRRRYPFCSSLAFHPSSSFSFSPAAVHPSTFRWERRMSDRDQPPDEEGADLAAQFFKALSDRNISLDIDDDEDEDDYEENENNNNDEAGLFGEDDADDAILREYDVPSTKEGMTELTDTQIYDEMKDRVLESAGAFVELASVSMVGVGDDEDGALGLVTGGRGSGEEEEGDGGGGMYRPPMIVPDSGLTAGEVVELVLAGLRNNDNPRPDYGIEILFGYSSPGSFISEQLESGMLTPSQYREFLLSSSEDNAALFSHGSVIIEKADFSPDGLRGYFTARLMPSSSVTETGGTGEDVAVNFILSTTGTNDDDCWLIDSMLIRPSKLRRRRGR